MVMMMNCFCGMVDRRKAFDLVSSRDHCQRFSPSRISDRLRAGFEPAQNSGLVEWSCVVVIITTPRRHRTTLHHGATTTTWRHRTDPINLLRIRATWINDKKVTLIKPKEENNTYAVFLQYQILKAQERINDDGYSAIR